MMGNSAWRKLEGLEDPEKFVKTYKSKIINMKPYNPTAILFMGTWAAGTSSFINAILSVERGHKITIANSNPGESSGTSKLAKYPGHSWLKNYLFMESMGIRVAYEDGLHPDDFVPLIQGHIKKNYEFNENKPIDRGSAYYIDNPTLENKTHCVVFVLDATTMDWGPPTGHRRKIKSLLKDLMEAGVHGVFVLTKCDKLCSDVQKDASYIFKSKKVEQAVKATSEIFDVEISSIHPVVNYAEDLQLTTAKTIPIIVALHDILQNANNHYEYVLCDEDVV